MLARVLEYAKHYGLGSTLTYTLGRFPQVRGSYGVAVGAMQRLGAVPGMQPHSGETCFGGQLPATITAAMHANSAAFDLTLPAAMVQALAAYCATAPRKDWGTLRTVPVEAIRAGRLPDGSPVFVADVVGVDMNTTALQLARDPVLLAAVTRYLGYAPIGAQVRILHSPVVDAPFEARRLVQTVDYHFDVQAYNFVYANFYLTDVTVDSGAHQMVIGSHADKPAKWLFSSARRSEREILQHYGEQRVKTIIGPAGTGFLQDSSCYHRVLAPKTRERLMLHVRYY